MVVVVVGVGVVVEVEVVVGVEVEVGVEVGVAMNAAILATAAYCVLGKRGTAAGGGSHALSHSWLESRTCTTAGGSWISSWSRLGSQAGNGAGLGCRSWSESGWAAELRYRSSST